MSLKSALTPAALFVLILAAASCERTAELSAPVGGEAPLEERLEIQYDDRAAPRETAALVETFAYPLFDVALLELGYQVCEGDAATFKARDPQTGNALALTMIPCLRPGDDSRVAFVMFFRADDGSDWAMTAAEYYKEEGYEIPHPIDMTASVAAGAWSSPESKDQMILMNESSSRYWKCVAKRFAAGCIGCATACALSGPGWGACTAACCGGTAIAALVACAFTIFLGW